MPLGQHFCADGSAGAPPGFNSAPGSVLQVLLRMLNFIRLHLCMIAEVVAWPYMKLAVVY